MPVLPMARLHGMGSELARMQLARMKRSLVFGTVLVVTWLIPIVAVAVAITVSG
ncbi:MAG TPA: hypothetical protein VL326_19835 [Kofleriaceae bacterium]|nr:hypothetical protein [Kofleriaceae bacterium]